MSETKYEVLIVDDVLNAASDYAELIRLRTNLKTTSCSNPDDAMEVVKNHPIKVVILDQIMPIMSGTQLFEKLVKINPELKAIMLSGQASASEVGQALNSGFMSYMHKSNINDLPNNVIEQYTKYYIDHEEKIKNNTFPVLYREQSPWWNLSKHIIEYKLENISILDDKFIFVGDWKTVRKLHAGETVTIEEIFQIEHSLVITETTQAKINSELKLEPKSLLGFKASLQNEISQQLGMTETNKESNSTSRKVECTLPKQPDDPSTIFVVSQNREQVNVYLEVRCLISKSCTNCNSHQLVSLVVYLPTKKFATRQTDYLSDNTYRTVDTGVHQYS